MSFTVDAITKLRANKVLGSKNAGAFKFTGLDITGKSATYNKEYLKSKFSPAEKLNIEQKVASEKHKQRIFTWMFYGLIVCGTYFVYQMI